MVSNGSRGKNPLVTKLTRFVPLSPDETRILEALCANEERFRAGVELGNEGDAPRRAFVMTRGLACRYRIMADGRRQILTFLLPGDFFELHGFLIKAMDHSVKTLAPTWLAPIDRDTITDLIACRPRIAAAIWWCSMQDAAIMRERIVMLGRHNARGRLAYILCEMVWRKRALGLSEDHAIPLPLTQTDIADTLGLTPVHVNRILQEFRRDGLITLTRRRLHLHDMERLQSLAELTQDYLHFTGIPSEAERYLALLEPAQATAAQDTCRPC